MKSSWSTTKFPTIFLFFMFSTPILGLNNCPTTPIRSVIQRAAETTKEVVLQMQMIRRILEDIYGGTWGVLIIKNPSLISKEVHWTFPDHNNSDGSPAFCLTVVNTWQYNVFKTGHVDSPQRVTVDNIIQRFSSGTLPKKAQMMVKKQTKEVFLDGKKQVPRRYSIAQLDNMLAKVLEDRGFHGRFNRSPRLVN